MGHKKENNTRYTYMNTLKQSLKNRDKTIGSWLALPTEATAEIMAQAGFEWLVIDMEHAPIGIEEAARLIRIVDLAGLPVLCRLPYNAPDLAKNVLDAGATGIIVPMVESKEEAQRAVESAYYPPVGKRGVGLARAQAYGSGFETYKKKIQDSLVVIAMIETQKGIENVGAIATTPGIDALLIGPYDMSASLGLIGQLDHPTLRSSLKKVIEAAHKAGIGCGLHVVHPEKESIAKALNDGYTFLVLGVDMIFLDQAATMAVKRAV
ncbi:MAG: HpcH/HpaI aldolase family protein [bacterium]